MDSNEFDLLNYVNNFKKYNHVNSVLKSINKTRIKNPHISIVIPTYNRCNLLKETINSALNQINVPCSYEVIVLDNSSDNEQKLEELISSYNDDRLFYYRNSENIGMFGNWNRCIELANGEWISFLHDDDLLYPDYLYKSFYLLNRKKDIGVLLSKYKVVKNNIFPTEIKDMQSKNIKKILKIDTKLKKIVLLDNIIFQTNAYCAPTCGTIIKKKYAIKEGGFNEKLFPSGDWFFFYKFNKKYKVYKAMDFFGEYRFLENESLNANTIRSFIIDRLNFGKYSSKNSIIANILNKTFKYEYHADYMQNRFRDLGCNEIKTDEFDHLCKYKVRPTRLKMLKAIQKTYTLVKNIETIIFG